jgi:ABC-type dipeptide/oligopeptide/nickel transport system permease component
MGVTILYTTLVYGFNLLVDLSYGWIDPRMRAGEQG